MKLRRGPFWCVIICVWILEVVIFLTGRNEHGEMSGMGIVFLLALLAVYIGAIMLRLKDAGKSMAMVFVCTIIPVFMFVIGSWPSEEDSYYDENKTEQGVME
ncbi:DUF805 domain-containing protein [Roseburia sp. 499]|uniref:DUF805 domain-containing protein n=1 Tax=Roseburia sp. 499 TaxID=1261634 RepID=UPI000951B409|nr:DUF805 domain-containing protein [Roseburia sp. 499]WVK69610.1 DUF805 domain-containing protein [Roseburia sp. 499]